MVNFAIRNYQNGLAMALAAAGFDDADDQPKEVFIFDRHGWNPGYLPAGWDFDNQIYQPGANFSPEDVGAAFPQYVGTAQIIAGSQRNAMAYYDMPLFGIQTNDAGAKILYKLRYKTGVSGITMLFPIKRVTDVIGIEFEGAMSYSGSSYALLNVGVAEIVDGKIVNRGNREVQRASTNFTVYSRTISKTNVDYIWINTFDYIPYYSYIKLIRE